MKLQTAGADTKSIKAYLYTESLQVFQALEHFSDDAMHDLSKTKDNILLSIKEDRRRVMDHIAFMERKAIEHIEQSVTKGKRTLEDHTEILAKRLRKEEIENLQKKKLELKSQLMEHYHKTASRMPVRLDIDETIDNIYENPKLTLIKIQNGQKTEEDILEVSQLFSTGDGPMAKTIIVEGEPGTGKTSLCKKIVCDWCKINEKVEREPITSSLGKFEFVFYIILRFVKSESEVKAMIVEHILKKIDSACGNAHSLLGEILKSKHCLLLLDGLDEWRREMPDVETSWKYCTVLITTRPYKLAELKVIPTQMDKYVKLGGVQNPEELVLKVIRKLEEYHKTNKPPESCIKDLKDKHLWHFSKNPVVLVHIVWLWQKSKLRQNMSRATLYQEIIDERWYEMCDKKEQYKDPQELYDVLSEIAFYQLFSENEDESLVFNIKGEQLQKFKQYKDTSLESGIMSASNVPGERSPQYQFLHKTFQEYFAAVFLSKCGSTMSTSCKLVKERFSKHRNESVFALEQVFLFLCGLNPDAGEEFPDAVEEFPDVAEEFSKTLNELFTEACKKEGSAVKARKFQEMILSGYDAAERSGHIGAKLCLQHIVLEHKTDMSRLKWCLDDKRISNLKSLRIDGKGGIASALQCMDDPSVLDLDDGSHFPLDYLELKNVRMLAEKFMRLVLVGIQSGHHLDYRFTECTIEGDIGDAQQPASSRYVTRICLEKMTVSAEAFRRLIRVLIDSGQNVIFKLTECTIDGNIGQQLEEVSNENAQKVVTQEPAFFDTQPIISLEKMTVPADVFTLLVPVMSCGHGLLFALIECTLEGEIIEEHVRVGNQTVLQVETQQPATSHNPSCIVLRKMTVSADMFRRLVIVVLQSEYKVGFQISGCTIEGDIRELHEKVGDQAALQVEAPQPASSGYITLNKMTVSADVFRRLVLVVLQAGHHVICTLTECKIEGDTKHLHENEGDQTALQVEAPQPASSGYITTIELKTVIVPAEVLRGLVSVVIQHEHRVCCELKNCTIEPVEEVRKLQVEMEDQPAIDVEGFSMCGQVWCIQFINNR
ncbi:uncharacterized protein LOC128227095 [Mya arenaria]|uniref:uncharacterized protein LOC128227095 n=1 Tax=Mya arenaria TaxID=6604 RepID=UPI0022E5EEC3|nr:uncharacterized protein LOC128227095 [Mya arenaria]